MEKKIASAIMFTLLLMGVLTLASSVQRVKSDYVWTGTIYIRVDGSLEPSTAPISSFDNVTYTLTDNIAGNVPDGSSAIVIQRDNIMIDGAGHTLQGILASYSIGIELTGRSNVTIKNMKITAFARAIWLSSSFNNSVSGNKIANNGLGIWFEHSSSNNSVSGNTITANRGDGIELDYSSDNNVLSGNTITANSFAGVFLYSSYNNALSGNNITANSYGGVLLYFSYNNALSGNNITANSYGNGVSLWNSNSDTLSGNNITANGGDGVGLLSSSNETLSGNNIANNVNGVSLWNSNSSTLSGNNITANDYYGVSLWSSNSDTLSGNNITANNDDGIWLWSSRNNIIYHNNFVNNTRQVVSSGLTNVWDDGYPSGGNYWNDYVSVDVKSGPNQDLPRSDGIGDTPYIIDANNRDRYPLMNPTPTANFTWSPPMPRATKTVTFNASSSAPNISGTIVSYTWDFNDGSITTTTNPTITHCYAVSKRYNVSLTVLNSVGLTGSITKRVKITHLADINMDGVGDIKDLARVSASFGSYPGHLKWNPACDINGDNRIDIYDVAYVAKYFGWHYP